MIWKVILRNTTYKRAWQIVSRNMSESKIKATEKVAPTSETAEKVASMSASELMRNKVHVSHWNKMLLVFVKRYKTTAEVPDILPFEVVDKARNWVRVKVSNIMMFMTFLGSLLMIYLGKRAAERGETVSQLNIDWHREYNEKAKREEEEAAARRKQQA